jgi:transposase
MNGPKYVTQVLQGPLKDLREEMEAKRSHSMLVVEDGAPGHRSKLTKNAQSKLGIIQLTYPPNSPDLNPIEPLWYLLKNRIANIPGSANTLDKLWEAAQKVWEEITPDKIRKFTGTMSDRVEAVTKAKGWHTKY